MKKDRVSLKDIAQRAGVSTAAVSYVLSRQGKENQVGAAAAARIRQIADELNYQPHYLAKSLRSGKTQTIGLILADISNPFFANIARIVEDEAKKNGYTVIIGSSDENAEKSWDLINVFLNRQVDGFIMVSAEKSASQIQYLQQKNYPLVLLDRHFPEMDTNFVCLDNFKASYEATKHLINNGYERIGFVAYESALFHMHERIRGYRQALQDYGIEFQENWLKKVGFVSLAEEMDVHLEAMLQLPKPIDALLFATYKIAISGLNYFRKAGITVPDDIGIVSFGQAEGFDLYYCPITYVEQPIESLGKTAVEVLLQAIDKSLEKPFQVLEESKLVIRESSRSKIVIPTH